MKLGPITIDTSNISPTSFFGGMAAAGVAVLGAPYVYPQLGKWPLWVVQISVAAVVIGTALAHYNAADAEKEPNAQNNKTDGGTVPPATGPLVK